VLKGHSVVGSIQFPVADLNDVLGLSVPQDQLEGPEAVKTISEPIRRYAADHFSIAGYTGPWAIDFHQVQFHKLKKGSYVYVEYRLSGEPFVGLPISPSPSTGLSTRSQTGTAS